MVQLPFDSRLVPSPHQSDSIEQRQLRHKQRSKHWEEGREEVLLLPLKAIAVFRGRMEEEGGISKVYCRARSADMI